MRPIVLAAGIVLALSLALSPVAPTVALAGSAPSKLALVAPAAARFGEAFDVRVRLTDAQGAPISGGRVAVVTPMAFLNSAGDVVLVDGRTDKDGVVAGQIEVRSTEPLALRALFAGDAQYAPADASARVLVGGEAYPMYAQHAGVRVPLLNEAPRGGDVALGGAQEGGMLARMLALWPALSGWPIAATLIVVWSLFAFTVSLIYRIPSAGKSS